MSILILMLAALGADPAPPPASAAESPRPERASPPVPPPPGRPSIVTLPDWVRPPTGDEIVRIYPAEAMAKGVGGKVLMDCNVAATGLVDDCQVVEETPAGLGFGAASVTLASVFRMRPRTVDGVPEASRVKIPLVFNPPPPDAVALSGDRALVTLDCEVLSEGRLTDCRVLTEQPAGAGFGPAALGAASRVRVERERDGGPVVGTRVTIPMTVISSD